MRIAEYKQTGFRDEERTIIVPAEYDENGDVIAEEHEETVIVQVPVYGTVYRDATQAEINEMESRPPIDDDPNPTTEERIAILEEQLAAAKILLGVE